MKFCHFVTKKIILSKSSTENVAWKLFLGPFVFIESYVQPQQENEILEQADYTFREEKSARIKECGIN